MTAWRALFICSVSLLIISPQFFEAFSIAPIRAEVSVVSSNTQNVSYCCPLTYIYNSIC
jgi:hypothetical protein